jgi:hypothetical protein
MRIKTNTEQNHLAASYYVSVIDHLILLLCELLLFSLSRQRASESGFPRHQSACPDSQNRGMMASFSGNYHVSDSIDWYSSSRPSQVGPRTAKRRRTEGQYIRDSADVSEPAGRLSSRLILVANVCEKRILGPSVGSLVPAAESAPRALHQAAPRSV